MVLYRLAEMSGRADVDTLAQELSMRDLLHWVQYWRQKDQRGTSDPEVARRMLEALR
jgi:hypothetical protein